MQRQSAPHMRIETGLHELVCTPGRSGFPGSIESDSTPTTRRFWPSPQWPRPESLCSPCSALAQCDPRHTFRCRAFGIAQQRPHGRPYRGAGALAERCAPRRLLSDTDGPRSVGEVEAKQQPEPSSRRQARAAELAVQAGGGVELAPGCHDCQRSGEGCPWVPRRGAVRAGVRDSHTRVGKARRGGEGSGARWRTVRLSGTQRLWECRPERRRTCGRTARRCRERGGRRPRRGRRSVARGSRGWSFRKRELSIGRTEHSRVGAQSVSFPAAHDDPLPLGGARVRAPPETESHVQQLSAHKKPRFNGDKRQCHGRVRAGEHVGGASGHGAESAAACPSAEQDDAKHLPVVRLSPFE